MLFLDFWWCWTAAIASRTGKAPPGGDRRGKFGLFMRRRPKKVAFDIRCRVLVFRWVTKNALHSKIGTKKHPIHTKNRNGPIFEVI